MIRFSANLGFLWADLPLLDRIEAAARAGFRAVELHYPYAVPPQTVRDTCRRLGITLLGVNTDIGTAPNQHAGLAAVVGRERDFQALIGQSLDWVAAAGGNSVHAMAGLVPPEQRAEAADTLVANLREAAPRAAARGLTLLLEPLNQRNMPGYFYSTVEEVDAIIERVGAPNVKIMFDVYHIGVSEGDVITRMRRFWPHVGHVQIAAVPSRAEPDEGEIAYPAIFRELERLGYEGWIGCEYRPRGTTEEGLAWVKHLGVSL
ncbi:MAG TPA: TIM barrel protein [Devosiaceae bacterium]|nr:TIM barrel protein [Devosiaceae bacterium]